MLALRLVHEESITICVSAPDGHPRIGVPHDGESPVLQEEVGANSSEDERRGAEQLNLEFRRRIRIRVAR